MHLAHRRLLTTTVSVLALVTAGCGGGSPEHRAHPAGRASAATAGSGGVTRDDAPQLKPLWTARAKGTDGYLPLDIVSSGDTLAVLDTHAVTAIARDTGKTLWTRTRAGKCSQGTAAGDSVIVMQTGSRCDDVQAVDLRTGRVRWTSHVRHHPKYGWNDGLQVGVGHKVATVRTECGAMERFDLATGRYLGVIALDIGDCTFTTATTGREVVVADRIPDPGEPALMAYDADTGRRLWARRSRGSQTELMQLVAADPLVLDIKIDHHRLLRRYDATGRSRAILGRQLNWFTGIRQVTAYGARGGVLVGQYHGTPEPSGSVYGWDLSTGRTDWIFAESGYVPLGVGSHGFLASSYAATEPRQNGDATVDTWIGERGPGADDKLSPIGWIAGEQRTSGSAVVGNLLLLGDNGAVTAYRLPAASDGAMPTALTSGEPTKGWATGDVRPDPGSDPCAAVKRSTLKAMGFTDQVRLPAPIDCDWHDYGRSGEDLTDSEVELQVQADVAEPSGETTADAAAQRAVKDRLGGARESWGDYNGGGPKPVEIDGVGDEAWVADDGYLGSGMSYLLIRRRNVVVEVRASAKGPVPGWSPTSGQVGAAAWQAATDVFGSLGLDVSRPSAGAEGKVTSVRPACALLRADATRLVDGAKARDLTQPGQQRASGCSWSAGDGELTVLTYAAEPTALPKRTADAAAALVYHESGSGRRLPGLGDAADVDGYAGSGGYGPEATVTSRRDNLVVQVDYTAPAGTSLQDARAAGVRLARRALTQRG